MSSKSKGESKRISPCYRFLSLEIYNIKKYFKSASIDGIDHVTEGKSKLRRVTWGIILLISFGACLYFLVGHGVNFASQPTSTTLRRERPVEGLPFPAVTVCNLNPVLKSYAEEQNIASFLEFFFSDFFQEVRDCDASIENLGLANSSLTFDELFRNGGSPRDVFIHSCNFAVNGTRSTNCIDDMLPVLTDYGLCHTFNSLSSGKPDTFFHLSGSRYGLRIILNITQGDYIASLDDDAGVIVSVHNRHTFPDIFENGIAVGPGKHARISITSRHLVDSTNTGRCRNDFSGAGLPDTEYSTSGCRAAARYEYLVDDSNCNCVEFYNPLLERLLPLERNCTLADACCIAAANFEVERGVDCPPPCEYTTYDTTVSYSKYPSNAALELLEEFSESTGINVETVQDDFVSVNVYFSDLYLENAETVVSYGPRLLVADIGGTLGLFLGASIISFMEIVLLFYDEIKAICCVSKKVRKGWDEFELKLIRSQKRDSAASDPDTDDEEREKLQKDPPKAAEKNEKPPEKISNVKNTPV